MVWASSVSIAASADQAASPHGMTALCLVRSLKECFVVVGILAGYLASYQYAEQVRRTVLDDPVLTFTNTYRCLKHMGGLGP